MSKSKLDYRIKAEQMLEGKDIGAQVALLADFLELYDLLHDTKHQRFNRSLPLSDLFVDRWEKSQKLNFGKGTSVYDSVVVLGDVSVGENTWVGPNVILDGSGKLAIGDHCSISANVQIYTHDSVEWATSGGSSNYAYESTSIGSNCYIGPNVVITKGVTVGDGCVVGANSFLNRDLAAGSRVAGNPAKDIK